MHNFLNCVEAYLVKRFAQFIADEDDFAAKV
jgi:hypothetical protein